MTINSAWVEVLKEEIPEAFTPTAPFKPDAGFIDGMPLLLKGQRITRWEDLLQSNFVWPIRRLFSLGASVVVLALDEYTYCPSAKSITQANRSKKCAPFEFGETQKLENLVPENYNEQLRNRAYKRRVMEFVSESLSGHVKLLPHQSLIIDYAECPIKYFYDGASNEIRAERVEDVAPSGECDVKFTRWVRMFGSMVVHSVDGDFIPIALIEYERQISTLVQDGQPLNMALYRIEYNMEKPSAAGKKRGRDEDKKNEVAKAKPARTMEFVNISMLYEGVKAALLQCESNRANVQTYVPHLMRMFSSLVALTGTDFTRGMPHLGPKTVWGMLPDPSIWQGFLASYSTDDGQLLVKEACSSFVARLYLAKFQKHARGRDIVEVITSLKNCEKLSEKTKRELPSVERVETTIRNINWLMCYWMCHQPVRDPVTGEWDHAFMFPDPVCPAFGFKRSKGKSGAAVQWMDD